MKADAASERTVLAASALALAALAWLVLFRMAHSEAMSGAGMVMPDGMTMPGMEPGYPALALMWMVMMAAMMLPGSIPVLTLYAQVQRRRQAADGPWVRTAIFACGYLLVWSGYSLAAAWAQAGLHRLTWLSPEMTSSRTALSATLLMAAGAYQWLPAKHRCLSRCRSPLGFLTAGWREGRLGALRMGLSLGSWCVGCCWILMLLLFVGGVMNLVWVALLAGFVAAERLLPRGDLVARIGGVAAVAWGIVLVAQSLR